MRYHEKLLFSTFQWLADRENAFDFSTAPRRRVSLENRMTV